MPLEESLSETVVCQPHLDIIQDPNNIVPPFSGYNNYLQQRALKDVNDKTSNPFDK